VVLVLAELLEASWHSFSSAHYVPISAVADVPSRLHNHSSSRVSCHEDMHHVSVFEFFLALSDEAMELD
jgi:hypothetical protein